MTTATIPDIRSRRDSGNLSELQTLLDRLIGEPFRFLRFTYGDELTIHFGELEPSRSPKLKDTMFGAFMLGVRASSWAITSAAGTVCSDGFRDPVSGGERRLTKEEKVGLETNPPIPAGCDVVAAVLFVNASGQHLVLEVMLADGSSIWITPPSTEVDEPGDDGLPEIADWELFTPNGFLSVGPGLAWSFEPKKTPSDTPRPTADCGQQSPP